MAASSEMPPPVSSPTAYRTVSCPRATARPTPCTRATRPKWPGRSSTLAVTPRTGLRLRCELRAVAHVNRLAQLGGFWAAAAQVPPRRPAARLPQHPAPPPPPPPAPPPPPP